MTSEQFKDQLEKLRQVITHGLAHYTVWKKLRLRDPDSVEWSLEEQNQILGRFRGFFTPVAIALLDMALIEFAKVFDTDTRTASLRNLLSAARENPILVPNASADDLNEISSDFEQYKGLVTSLMRKRSQQLVHVDAEPDPVDPIMTADFDKLAEWVMSAFNTLSTGHDKNFFSLKYLLKTSEEQTEAVMGTLLEDIARRQQKHHDEMVQIGVRQLQRAEADLGRTLDKETMGHVIGTLGLTEEQMQRVEEEYHGGSNGRGT